METKALKIDIISDTVCPWCFIGKRRLERALAMRPDLTLDITWRPFQLNPEMPADGIDRDLYLSLKFGDEDRAKKIYRAVSDAGAGENLDFNFAAMKRTPNTLKSHRLLHYAGLRGDQEPVVENLFRAYFFNGADIGDTDTLIDIAVRSGLDGDAAREYLNSDKDLELVRAEDTRARQIGVNGVPCFIIADSYAVSGAQEPEVFLQVFAVAEQAQSVAAE